MMSVWGERFHVRAEKICLAPLLVSLYLAAFQGEGFHGATSLKAFVVHDCR